MQLEKYIGELEAKVKELESAEPIHQANLNLCQSVGDSLKNRVVELEKALEFYAPAARYDKKDGWLELDGGATARAALNHE